MLHSTEALMPHSGHGASRHRQIPAKHISGRGPARLPLASAVKLPGTPVTPPAQPLPPARHEPRTPPCPLPEHQASRSAHGSADEEAARA